MVVSVYVMEHTLSISIVFFRDKSMGFKDNKGIANLDPRGMVGRIYVEDH